MIFASQVCYGQARKFPKPVNTGAGDYTAPFISPDGNTIIFQTNYSETGQPDLHHSTYKSGKWSEPVLLPKEIGLSKVNYLWGHSTNFDGSIIYFTSRRSSIGGYDILYSINEGNRWSLPKNIGTGVNTKGHEGCPSVNIYGDEIYFIRCTTISEREASGCKIMHSKMENGNWTEPKELPSSINQGNVLAPRILSDDQTLVFASNKPGGKGGYDLYMTRKENGGWSAPVPLDYVNSPDDEFFTSSRFRGLRLVFDRLENNTYQIFETPIPPQFRPVNFLKLDYELSSDYTGGGEQMVIYDSESGEELLSKKVNLGSNTAILADGKEYHLLIYSPHAKRTFISKKYQVMGLRNAEIRNTEFSLTEPARNLAMEVDGISFTLEAPYISGASGPTLDVMTKFLQANQDRNINIEVVMTNYLEDSVMSSLDLTEIKVDSIVTIYKRPVPLQAAGDSLGSFNSQDSLGLSGTATQKMEDSVVVTLKYTYHNNRTVMESAALKDYLEKQGVPTQRINFVGRRETPLPDDNRKKFLRIRFN